ncbi:MAG: cysteine--tRNA ligase [Cellvibrionaceae bacterium]|nr:cysteine--tRNA ligase [Cellvibrionaceae bacterium]
MSLKIYNTLDRSKVDFVPIEAGKIRLYVCGMTVYDYCHIGHARVLVAFDVITRFLRAQGWEVEYVRNITDIDDKILVRAHENGEDYTQLTSRFIDAMHEDERQLHVLSPDQEPRATAYIADIIAMVATLVDKGYAYPAANGDVYYRVSRFPSYGRLSGKNPDELLSGARVGIEKEKEDPRDFALWKAAKPGEVSWDSPWGQGRPGWHIECSAMSKSCLGDTFDIHGGGPDLPFPHHENEIAQSEAANGCGFVNYWLHAGAVRVDGEKMSKSLGNFFTIRDVIKKYHPEVVRYLLVSSHYRSAINYSEDNLIEAKAGIDRFFHTLKDYPDVKACALAELHGSPYYQQFVAAMNDDFNTRVALAVMYDMVKAINSLRADPAQAVLLVAQLRAMADMLGILQTDVAAYLQSTLQSTTDHNGLSNTLIEQHIADRQQAKLDKDYARADEIRQYLTEQGIILEDSRQGTRWRRG